MSKTSERLSALRKESKKNQQEIADAIGIKQATYARYEGDKRKPKAEILSKLAQYFGVSYEYLLGKEVELKVFYKCLRALSAEQSKSLNQIEKDLGYPKNTMYSYKTKEPTASRLLEIANYFNVSVDYLLGIGNGRSLSVDLCEIVDFAERQMLFYTGKRVTVNEAKELSLLIRDFLEKD